MTARALFQEEEPRIRNLRPGTLAGYEAACEQRPKERALILPMRYSGLAIGDAGRAGIDGFRPHRLRDTFAVSLPAAGVLMEDLGPVR